MTPIQQFCQAGGRFTVQVFGPNLGIEISPEMRERISKLVMTAELRRLRNDGQLIARLCLREPWVV